MRCGENTCRLFNKNFGIVSNFFHQSFYFTMTNSHSISQEDLNKFFDVDVTPGAISELREQKYIEDSVINLHLSLMKKRNFRKRRYRFIEPAVSQLIQDSSKETIQSFFDGEDFRNYHIVFFAFHNLKQGNCGHYSLLCWVPGIKSGKRFFYYDSLPKQNLFIAQKLFAKIKEFTGLRGRTQDLFKECESPIQQNRFDCGVYVMAMIDFLATSGKISSADMIPKITQHYATRYRETLAAFITNPLSFHMNWEEALQTINSPEISSCPRVENQTKDESKKEQI